MFELSEEKLLMSSSDNSVKLTTHRIIHDSNKGRQQIMLEDFESYQLIRTSMGSYGFLLILILVITIGIILLALNNYMGEVELLKSLPPNLRHLHVNFLDYIWKDTGLIFLLIPLFIVLFFYLTSRRYFIKINGKYNSIEIRVRNLRNQSIKRMINKLVEQSEKIKQIIPEE